MTIILINIVLVVLLYLIITNLWQLAEKMLYDKVTPRLLDDVMAIILAIAIVY